jgi:CheY-like chemotaxis protein
MNQAARKKFEILLVEDNLGDAIRTKIAFRKKEFSGNLSLVADGEQALSFLNRDEPYSKAPAPDLILLDLNLPRMDGRTFLRRVRGHEKFKELKVVVLSGSQLDSDIREAIDMGANGYLVKPPDIFGFFKLLDDLADFLEKDKALPLKSAG